MHCPRPIIGVFTLKRDTTRKNLKPEAPMLTPSRRKPAQLQLFRGSLARTTVARPTHGGDESIGRRKTRRPLDPHRPVHVTLRSERARGRLSLLAPRVRFTVKALALRAAARHEVRVLRFVNVGNHLHLLVKARSRESFQNFLRQTAGQVAQAVTGARKGAAAGSSGQRRFWDALAYSRVVRSPREEVGLQKYFLKNLAETLGLPDPRALYRSESVVLSIPAGTGPPLEEVWA
ncbi:MAG: transposase [Bdellovibrionales bacterium]|nr:transposase [Bdellovibrionales bacterium]